MEGVIAFFGASDLVDLLRDPELSPRLFFSINGISSIIQTLFPVLLVFEFFYIFVRYNGNIKKISLVYDIPLYTNLLNKFLSPLIAVDMLLFSESLVKNYAIFKIPFKWYYLIICYIIWEFSHFIFHYTSHKVRILWCLHSPHHAPRHMNLSVIYVNFIFHIAQANLIRTSICVFFGVPIPALLFVMVIDGFWGAFIHVSEELLPNGRMGFLNRIILTPSHHRVHHSSNPEYIDKNFCNLLILWDWIFGTLKNQDEKITPNYGISRIKNGSGFLDIYFGEISELIIDVKEANSFREKMLLLIMPPGWAMDKKNLNVSK